MANVGAIERETQDRVVGLFRDVLKYNYLGNLAGENNSNIREEDLRKFLSRKHSDAIVQRVVAIVQRTAAKTQSLYDTNKEFYSLLRYGVNIQENVGEKRQMVQLIEWGDDFLDNDFYVAEEVTVRGNKTRRPDLVIYVNGIALVVIELKRSTVSVSEGIRQCCSCQDKLFIPDFFNTIQLICAGNDSEGLHYGVIETKEKYWLRWKENNPSIPNDLDRGILQMFDKKRFLEIIHDFLVFDRGIKKACRHNQYFGVKAAQKRIEKKEGGIIWHTQGSGKSLTMVWLAKWIREHIDDSRVVIITDRDELDKQIELVFQGVDEEIKRAKSGSNLISMLNAVNPWLMCSLIHKFGKRSDEDTGATAEDVAKYLEELRKNLPADFSPKGNIYVFVDECHRTQSGVLHDAMKEIVGDKAIFIGFTGTPLLKDDKAKSIEVFGPYIHEYRFNEAVEDKVVLDLKYEARDIDQYISRPDKVDLWFESKTRALNPTALAVLKQKWANLKKVFSTKERLSRIVEDITLDMATKPRLQNGRGNAMLVSESIYNACRFYEMFQQTDLKGHCAIITSYSPNANDAKGEISREGVTEKLKQYEIYLQMLKDFGYGESDTEKFEDAMKEKFVKEPAQMKLLIVVDKLLTGFDAPSATYLYIDKTMRDHGLFQAICRVNRLDGEDKEYGYVIDYKDLFKSLESAFRDYTSEAFAKYDKKDIEGLLTDRLESGKQDLDDALEAVHALCDRVQPQTLEAFKRYFYADTNKTEAEILQNSNNNSEKRNNLYKLVTSLVRRYMAIANELIEAGYTKERASEIKTEVEFYNKLKDEIKIASADYIDMKLYEPAMRQLLDTYIKADDSEKLADLNDMSLVQLLVERGPNATDILPDSLKKSYRNVQETLEANMRRLIISERPANPAFFDKMSTLLQTLIDRRREERLDYKRYLEEFIALSRDVVSGGQNYPASITTKGIRALYDNLNKNEVIALTVDNAIRNSAKDDWRDNSIKTKAVRIAIRKAMGKNEDDAEVETILEIVRNQYEY